MAEHSSPGDPGGRRLSQYRAGLLGEAARVGRVFEILLNRASYPPEAIQLLLKDIAKAEESHLQRAHGKIEARRRFKGQTSAPLLAGRSTNLLYLDESGRSAPEPLQPGAATFALSGISLTQESVDQYRVAADAIKHSFFGRANFAFHEPYMRQRYQDPQSAIDYSFNRNEARQQDFDQAISSLIAETNFVTFGVGVRKEAFRREFVETGIDPYLPTDIYALAITFLLERYVDMLASAPVNQFGRATFESQGPKEDAYHQLEYARLLLEGSQWIPDSAFRNWLETGLRFAPKEGSHPIELADFMSRDLFEWVRSDCSNSPKWWDLYCSKVYVRGDGLMGKFGIKVFPDADLREMILEHRRKYGAVGN